MTWAKIQSKRLVGAFLVLGLACLIGAFGIITPQAFAAGGVVALTEKAEIKVPNATTTDPSDEDGQALANNIYNENLGKIPADGAPTWTTTNLKTGKATGYFSVKGTNDKTYYTWASLNNTPGLRTIFDMQNADPNSYEFHLVYKNNSKEANIGLLVQFDIYKSGTMTIDDSRDVEVRSELGHQYYPSLGKTTGTMQPYQKFLSANKLSDAKCVYLQHWWNLGTDLALPNDTVELIIPVKNTPDITKLSTTAPDQLECTYVTDYSQGAATTYKNYTYTSYRRWQWKSLESIYLQPKFYNPTTKEWLEDAPEIDPYYLGKIKDAAPATDPNGSELQETMHWKMVGGTYESLVGYDPGNDMRMFGFTPQTTNYESSMASIYQNHVFLLDLKYIEQRLEKMGWTVEFRGHDTSDSVPSYFYMYDVHAKGLTDVASNTSYYRHVSVIPALLRNAPQFYWTPDAAADHDDRTSMPADWTADELLLHVYHADVPLGGIRGTASLDDGFHLQELSADERKSEVANGTIQVAWEYHAPGQTDADNVAVDNVDPNKPGVYKATFTRKFGAGTNISTYQYVYINGETTAPVTKTRTITEYLPDGTTKDTTQTATLDAKTTIEYVADPSDSSMNTVNETTTPAGSSESEWPAYAPTEVEGWTYDKQVDKQTVTAETEDAHIDIFYKHPVQEQETITRTIYAQTPDGVTTEKQPVTLTHTGTEMTSKDGLVTTWNEWPEDSWKSYEAPEVEGWTPDRAVVDEVTVTHGMKDAEEHIYYRKPVEETKVITRTIHLHKPAADNSVMVEDVLQPVTVVRQGTQKTTDGDIETTWNAWTTGAWGLYNASSLDVDGLDWTPTNVVEAVRVVSKDTPDAEADIYYTAVEKQTEKRVRDIYVHRPDKATDEHKQVVLLERNRTLTTTNDGMDAGAWSAWGKGTWDAFEAPAFKGWTPDKNVDKASVTYETANAEEHIYYTKDPDVDPSEQIVPSDPEDVQTEPATPEATPHTSDTTTVFPLALLALAGVGISLFVRIRKED